MTPSDFYSKNLDRKIDISLHSKWSLPLFLDENYNLKIKSIQISITKIQSCMYIFTCECKDDGELT